MAKSIMNAKQEERNSKYELTNKIAKDVVNGLNYDGNKNLRKVGIAIMLVGGAVGATIFINSYIR